MYVLLLNLYLIPFNFKFMCLAEFFFFTGSYDKCVCMVREKNKDDILAVVQTIFSHVAVQQKNASVIMLIVSDNFSY